MEAILRPADVRGLGLRGLAMVFLAGIGGASVPLEGQSAAAAERRIVDRAERLQRSGRSDEARSELADYLRDRPASPEALGLLYELHAEAGDFAAFLPFAEAAEAAVDAPVARLRTLWVEGLVGAGRTDSARRVADRWVRLTGEEAAVLALARTTVADGDPSAAIDLLAAAGARGDATRATRLLHADLLVEAGRADDAVEVWTSLLAAEDPALDRVAEDLGQSPDPAATTGALLRAVDRPGPAARAGALLGLRSGDPAGARRLAARVIGEDRPPFLREYVREADLAGEAGEVAWAAGELILLRPRPADKLRWRAMVADRSLAAGDTAAARAAFEALATETARGAAPHDAATRRLFGLAAAAPGRLDEARALLDRYAAAYPDSAGVRAGMYGALAEGYARAGDLPGGERVLAAGRAAAADADVGPIEASGGRLAFWAGARDSAIARTGRSLAEPGLGADARTERIQLLTTLQAADSAEVSLIGAAAFGLHRDPASFDPSPALRELAGTPASPGRAAALRYLGDRALASGRVDVATGLWRRVVDAYPRDAETPAALLGLARAASGDAARQWLERLIVGYPESALAPVARRLLSEIDEGDIGG